MNSSAVTISRPLEHPWPRPIVQPMTKWVLILLAAMIGLAILGFLVDAARVIAMILFVGCLIFLAVKAFTGRKG